MVRYEKVKEEEEEVDSHASGAGVPATAPTATAVPPGELGEMGAVDDATVAVAVEEEEEEAEDAITVKVKSTDDKTHDVRVSQTALVTKLKELLERKTSIPKDRQRLICLGKLLVDDKTLKESNVKDGNFVHLVPKPAASTSAGRGSVPVASNVDEIHIPAHIQEMLSRGEVPVGLDSMPGASGSRFSYEDEYELNIWRYRVRVLSMLMLFYYFMNLMASISIWMHPEDKDYPRGGQFRQIKPDIPLALVDTIENVLGITVAVVGLKAAVSNCTDLSKRFARELTTLAFVHFLNLFMWIVALSRGEIVQVPTRMHRHSTSNQDMEDSLRSIVGAMLIIHPILWTTMLSIAFRYHKMLVFRHQVLNPTPAPAAQDQQPANNTINVV